MSEAEKLPGRRRKTRTQSVQRPAAGYCNIKLNRVAQIQGGSCHTNNSEWGAIPIPLLLQGGSKNTRWFISHYDFRMGCDTPPPPLLQQGGSNKSLFLHDPQQQQHKLRSLLDLSATAAGKNKNTVCSKTCGIDNVL